MIRIVVFHGVLFAACGYAGWRGGGPERWAAGLALLAGLATTSLPVIPHRSYYGVEWEQLGIDVGLLIGLIGLAAVADRFWPIWAASVQLLTIAVHGVIGADPSILPIVYARFAGELGYFVLALLALGAWRHQRRAPEPDWSARARPRHENGAGRAAHPS